MCAIGDWDDEEELQGFSTGKHDIPTDQGREVDTMMIALVFFALVPLATALIFLVLNINLYR